MRRRALLAVGAWIVASVPVRAEHVPVIGYLSGRSLATDAHLLQVVKGADEVIE